MNKLFTGALLALFIFTGIFSASAEKVFYDSKSWTVNVFGDYKYLSDQECGAKMDCFSLSVPSYVAPQEVNYNKAFNEDFCESIAKTLTRDGYGKKVLDILTNYGTSEATLRKLALKNAQIADKELGMASRAAETRSLNEILEEDCYPILMHNYIVVNVTTVGKHKQVNQYGDEVTVFGTYTHPVIFRVDIDRKFAEEIMHHLGSDYYKIPSPKIVYVTSKMYYNDIIKEAPDFAIRGVLLRRNPARISIGENADIKKGDLVSIYSQRINKNGEQYSKRISRARVCGVWDDEAQINFEANTAGNRKNGDIVVKTPDSKSRWGIAATWMPHTWGGEVRYDYKAGFTKSGIIHHLLIDLGASVSEHPGDTFLVPYDPSRPSINTLSEYDAPIFANFGIGYGIGKTFLGFIDVMPFVVVQYDMGLMFEAKASNSDTSKPLVGSAVRAPIGLRVSCNVGYPVRFFVEAGMAPRFEIKTNDQKIITEAMNYQNMKRDGIFLNLGFMF